MIIHECEQNSVEWYRLRAGKPTASEFSRIINQKALLKSDLIKDLSGHGEEKDLKKMKLEELQKLAFFNDKPTAKWVPTSTNYVYDLVSEVLFGIDETAFPGNDATDHGNAFENQAVKAYEELTKDKASTVGFVTDDEMTCGCSPDRLVGDGGLLEIKCPFSKSKYVEYLHKSVNGCPSDFYVQIQGQLMLTERDWCDLVIYHPEGFDTKVVRVLADASMHDSLKTAIAETIKQRDIVINEITGF